MQDVGALQAARFQGKGVHSVGRGKDLGYREAIRGRLAEV